MRSAKEEYAIILDFLPHGYPFDQKPMHRKTAIVQAIGKEHFLLLELMPKKGINLKSQDKVYIGEGKRDEIHHIISRINYDKLTETAKGELKILVDGMVDMNESRFVEFFSKAGPINARRHQIELLPGVGKKHMWEILEARKDGEFKSFDDIKKRVKLIPNPKRIVIKRIMMEINNEDKHRIFVGV
jgi:putative nucleotide binding protein